MAAVAIAVAVALGGCGAPSADLFAVERSGAGAGAKLQLIVSDSGRVRCNGEEHELPGDRLLTARALARELQATAELGIDLPPGPDTTFRYTVHVESGTVSFADTSPRRPDALTDVAAFTRVVARQVCGLAR